MRNPSLRSAHRKAQNAFGRCHQSSPKPTSPTGAVPAAGAAACGQRGPRPAWRCRLQFHTQCPWQHFLGLPTPHPQRAVPGGGHGWRQAERDAVTSPAKGPGPGPRAPMGSPAQSLVTCPECQHLVSCSPWGTPPWVVEGVRRSRPAPGAPNWVQCWDPSTRGAWVGWGEPSAEPPGWPHGATGPRSPGGSTQGGQSDFMKHIWLNELLRERRRPAQPAMPPGPCVP